MLQEKLNVEELSDLEMTNIEGGLLGLIGLAVGLTGGAYLTGEAVGKAYYYFTH